METLRTCPFNHAAEAQSVDTSGMSTAQLYAHYRKFGVPEAPRDPRHPLNSRDLALSDETWNAAKREKYAATAPATRSMYAEAEAELLAISPSDLLPADLDQPFVPYTGTDPFIRLERRISGIFVPAANAVADASSDNILDAVLRYGHNHRIIKTSDKAAYLRTGVDTPSRVIPQFARVLPHVLDPLVVGNQTAEGEAQVFLDSFGPVSEWTRMQYAQFGLHWEGLKVKDRPYLDPRYFQRVTIDGKTQVQMTEEGRERRSDDPGIVRLFQLRSSEPTYFCPAGALSIKLFKTVGNLLPAMYAYTFGDVENARHLRDTFQPLAATV